MSDHQSDSHQPRPAALAALATEFVLLDPADQELVLAIVARLPFHDPDVSFMDFDE